MARPTHPHMMLPAIQPSLTRSQSHNTASPTSSIVSRSATDPVSPSSTNARRSNSAAPSPSDRAPRAAQTLPTDGTSPDKKRTREKDTKQEKHRRLHLHTHFPHPHIHALSAGLPLESSHQRSRSHDNRHRRTHTDTQTPTILVNDSSHESNTLSSKKNTSEGHPSDYQSPQHRPHHHHHYHTNQNHSSKDDLKTMLRPTRPGLRPRAVSDSSRPSLTSHTSSNPLARPVQTRPLPSPRVPTTASLISTALDRANALKISQLEASTPETLSRLRSSAAKADAELRTRLSNISKSSTEIARRLDYTYYNLLEKLGQLGTTVSSFQTLLAQTRSMSVEFEVGISEKPGSGGLQADSIKEAQSFQAGFEGRKKRLGELEERIRNGKVRAEVLGGRLEACTKTVKEFEAKEQQWRQKVSLRLRIFWVCAALLLALSLGFGVWWESRGISGSETKLKAPRGATMNGSVIEMEISKEGLLKKIATQAVPDDVQELLRSVVGGQGMGDGPRHDGPSLELVQDTKSATTGDRGQAVLKILDEL